MSKSNGTVRRKQANGDLPDIVANSASITGKHVIALEKSRRTDDSPTLLDLLICIGGIYASFLTWGVLQERITTTNYGTETQREVFKYPVVMNTVQSTFAALFGYIFVSLTRKSPTDLPIIPNKNILWYLLLVALTSALSSPFGYSSLQYVDYITFILAKSCKLVPVMLLHVTLYGKRYPLQKYAVVALVTTGVALFTLSQSGGKKKKGADGNSAFGLALLGINLLLDGVTNATQDSINAKFSPYTGQQMMCALNVMSTFVQSAYLVLFPFLAQSGLGAIVGQDLFKGAGELSQALAFIQRHPAVGWDILGFAITGALGQVFIFRTLSKFGSLVLVGVTVTRKMLTMIISVVWFGHALSGMQWLSVALVFLGIGLEAYLSKVEKERKLLQKKSA
ncbi:putative UAA transporter [Septoria linicola]|nr:putative UAA transporter [Septoria linicola]